MRTPGRREQRDHERYLRQREARLEKQREYYQANRETILRRKQERGYEKVIIHN